MQPTQPFISCENLVKIYKVADLEVVALQGLDLEVQQGEMVSLVGASGSGKSTLLNIVGGLDSPSAGKVIVAGHDLLNMKERDRTRYKRDVVGFVWQQPERNLLPYLTARENVELPMMLGGQSRRGRRKRALELLDLLELSERAEFRPDRLSGGEQQRVALAVALANNPPLLLADEPTGQLDSIGVARIFAALQELNRAYGTTIIVVTHDPQVATSVDRVIGIRDGRTSTEIRRERSFADGSLQEEEWVILDRAGRLQLPQVYVETLALRGRVRARLEPDHVSIWPAQRPTAHSSGKAPEVHVWRPDRSYSFDKTSDDSPEDPVVVVDGLFRTFDMGVEQVQAIRNVSLNLYGGALTLIKGRSGSGKTTLLNLIGGLDEPTQGAVVVDGQSLENLSPAEKIELRRRKIGFVFQTFGLLPFLTARENVEVPLRLIAADQTQRQQVASEMLHLVGLTGRANHRTFELSGGEQQRVAVARALVGWPVLILADEPTGQLDTVTGSNVIALLKELSRQAAIAVVVASHDPKVEEAADFTYELHDGQLVNSS